MAAKHPKFQRANFHTFGRVKDNWRKPHGIDSKARQKLKSAGAHPDVGFRSPKATRYMHPSGKYESLVANVAELQKVNPKTHVARFARGVGMKKRKVMLAEAKKLGIKVLN